MPAATKVVTTRASGAAASRSKMPPVWSRSGWVSQIQRTSAGSSTVLSVSTKFRSGRPRPVSTTTGWAASSTNAFTGMCPIPGTSRLSARTLMSGRTLWTVPGRVFCRGMSLTPRNPPGGDRAATACLSPVHHPAVPPPPHPGGRRRGLRGHSCPHRNRVSVGALTSLDRGRSRSRGRMCCGCWGGPVASADFLAPPPLPVPSRPVLRGGAPSTPECGWVGVARAPAGPLALSRDAGNGSVGLGQIVDVSITNR